MKKFKCGVCKGKIIPLKENVYTVPNFEGVILFDYPGQKPKNGYIDVIDCPQCGCQKILAAGISKE